ncbi:MAG: VOC family protein [Thioalkalispiraceae bacterium]|jgi:catechol 2,3-dioxygenase-like lactoylglutathione lyase family enzyme
MASRPPPSSGLHHVALYVEDLAVCEKFYVDLMGMQVEWRPDDENVYLSSGNDNLALHQAKEKIEGKQKLDHIGFIMRKADDVDAWYAFLNEHNVKMRSEPKTHRDGARSFYCEDPAGTVVQIIYHQPLEHL